MKDEEAKVFIGKVSEGEKWARSRYRRSPTPKPTSQTAVISESEPEVTEANPLQGGNRPRRSSDGSKGVRFAEIACWRCGEKHRIPDCPIPAESVHCERCHQYGHLGSFCEARSLFIQNELSKKGKMEVLKRPPGLVDRREQEGVVPTQGGGSANTGSSAPKIAGSAPPAPGKPLECLKCGGGHKYEDCPRKDVKICWRCDGEHDHRECKLAAKSVTCTACKRTGHLTKWHSKWAEFKAYKERNGAPKTVVCYRCKGTHWTRECPLKRTAVKCEKCQVTGHLAEFCERAGVVCYRCGTLGHSLRNCPVDENSVACAVCDRKGHLAKYCTFKPKSLQAAIEDKGKCPTCGDVGHSAADCISERRTEVTPQAASAPPKPNNKAKEAEAPVAKCFVCGKPGHGVSSCPEREKLTQRCMNCGQFSHSAAECRLPRVVRDQIPALYRQEAELYCSYCNLRGHLMIECPVKAKVERSKGGPTGVKPKPVEKVEQPTEIDGAEKKLLEAMNKCANCGQTGHIALGCREGKRALESLEYIPKATAQERKGETRRVVPQCIICSSPTHPTEEHYERKAKLEKGAPAKEDVPPEFKETFVSTLGYQLFENPKWVAIRRAKEAWGAYTKYMAIMATLQNQAELVEAKIKVDKLQAELEAALRELRVGPMVCWEEVEEILAFSEAELRTLFSERLLARQEKFYEEQRHLNIVQNLDVKIRAAWEAKNVELALELNSDANKVIAEYEEKFGLWLRMNPSDPAKRTWAEVCARCRRPGHRAADILETRLEGGRRRVVTVCEALNPYDSLKCAYCGVRGHLWDNCDVRVTPQLLVSVIKGNQVTVSINKADNGFTFGVENGVLTKKSGATDVVDFHAAVDMSQAADKRQGLLYVRERVAKSAAYFVPVQNLDQMAQILLALYHQRLGTVQVTYDVLDLIDFLGGFVELHFLELPQNTLHGRDWLVGIVIQYLLGRAQNEVGLRQYFVAYSDTQDGLRGRSVWASFGVGKWPGPREWIKRTGYLKYALTYTPPFVDDNEVIARDPHSLTFSEARKKWKEEGERTLKQVRAEVERVKRLGGDKNVKLLHLLAGEPLGLVWKVPEKQYLDRELYRRTLQGEEQELVDLEVQRLLRARNYQPKNLLRKINPVVGEFETLVKYLMKRWDGSSAIEDERAYNQIQELFEMGSSQVSRLELSIQGFVRWGKETAQVLLNQYTDSHRESRAQVQVSTLR